AAQTTLSNAGLNSTPVEVKGDEAAGTALATDPGVGALLDPGSTVTLYYSAGPPPVTNASPDASASQNPKQEDQNQGNGNDNPASNNKPNDKPNTSNNSGPGKGGLLENVRENTPKGNKDRKGKKGK
ncbi:MAG TPA: PASTA domain-containing protein, partial [Rubrobacter sp.]